MRMLFPTSRFNLSKYKNTVLKRALISSLNINLSQKNQFLPMTQYSYRLNMTQR